MANSSLLVLRAERSTRRLSLAAHNDLWQVRAQRMGIIVNAVPARKGACGYGAYGYAGKRYGQQVESEERGEWRKKLGAS